MPFQPSTPEVLSLAEAVAVARYINDLQSRMETVVALLQDRGTAECIHLAESIAVELTLLQRQLATSER